MKTKFEDNVASHIPNVKDSQEPELPWKVTDEEMAKVESMDEEYRSAITSSPPLQVRPIFLILLVTVIFVVIVNTVINIAIENSEIQTDILRKERQVLTLRGELDKTATEKNVLKLDATKLEKRVSDLNAQKELYTAVIESLTKKTDENQIKE